MTMLSEISKEQIDRYKKAIEKIKRRLSEAEADFQNFKKACEDLDNAAQTGVPPQGLIDRRNIREQKLKGKLFELSSDAINEYNKLGGQPPYSLEKVDYDIEMDI